MNRYCVIGSGISGATIANLLSKKYSVDLFDKARGPGGRSSFKRLDKKKGFDHGTQYISPKTSDFKKFINILIKKKILKIWSGNHLFLNKVKTENKKNINDPKKAKGNDYSPNEDDYKFEADDLNLYKGGMAKAFGKGGMYKGNQKTYGMRYGGFTRRGMGK